MGSELLFCVGRNVRLVVIGYVMEVLGVDVLVIHGEDTAAAAIGTWKWEKVNTVVVVTGLLFLLLPRLACIAQERRGVETNWVTPAVQYVGGVTFGHNNGINGADCYGLEADTATRGFRADDSRVRAAATGRQGAAENTEQTQSCAGFQQAAAVGVANNFTFDQIMQMIVS